MGNRQNIDMYILGGGQCVGASCYYLKLGGHSLLLDCGIGSNGGASYHPDFFGLLQTGTVQSLNQISSVFISHAHLDHVGALGYFMRQVPAASVYMTALTRGLAEKQLWQYGRNFSPVRMQQQCVDVAYGQEIVCKDFRVNFLPAGHVPGAMMMLFSYGGRHILYTGDYSLSDSPLTMAAAIPPEEIDTLIICGLHARHRYYSSGNSYAQLGDLLKCHVENNQSLYIKVKQLSKGVELLKLINQVLGGVVPVYIDRSVLDVVRRFDAAGIPLLDRNNFLYDGLVKRGTHVVISSHTADRELRASYVYVDGDVPLHDDFADTLEFIRRINPRRAVIVHSPPSARPDDDSVEQYLMCEADCRTQFLFPENGEYITL